MNSRCERGKETKSEGLDEEAGSEKQGDRDAAINRRDWFCF